MTVRAGAVFILALPLLFAGCGAGGGGDPGYNPPAPPSPTVPPTAAIITTPFPPIGQRPLTVIFDASNSYDPDGAIVSYDWEFGDYTVGSGMIVSHEYTELGDYTATLTVIDNDNRPDTASIGVCVFQNPSEPDVTPPPAPADVRAEPGDGMAFISWREPDTCRTIDIAGYNICRRKFGESYDFNNPINGTLLPRGTSEYRDEGLTNGVKYFYVVASVDEVGNKSAGPEVSAIPQGP